jgi:hypothetical protein
MGELRRSGWIFHGVLLGMFLQEIADLVVWLIMTLRVSQKVDLMKDKSEVEFDNSM